MAWRRTVVSPVRQRWRCPSLELSYRYVQLGTNICSVLWWAAIVDSIVEMTIPGAASDGGNGGLAVLSCMCYGYSTHVILCTSHRHWEQGIVDFTTLSSLVAPWAVITTICSVAGDGRVVKLTFSVLYTLLLTYLISNRLYFEMHRVNEADHRLMYRVL